MIKLTAHANEMSMARGRAVAWTIETLEQPTATRVDPRDTSLTHAFRPIAEAGGKVLRVVYRRDGADIVVITAHFDRGARQ